MAENFMQIKVITPDRIFYEGEVSMVELRTSEGEIGVYPQHIPMTCILAPGVLKLHEAEGIRKAALHAGFIEILQDHATILAEVAEWPEEIDLNRAEESRTRAERRLAANDTNLDRMRAELSLRRALTRIDLADEYRANKK